MFSKLLKFLLVSNLFVLSQSFVSKKNIDHDSSNIDIQLQPINAIPNVIKIPWLPTISVLNFCLINEKSLEVHNPVIETAFDNVNSYLYNGVNTPLLLNYMYNDTSMGCDHYLNITSDSYTGFCTREFTTVDTKLYYTGCSITLNICDVQTAASFYNVLLHELLHVIGLDHPLNRNERSIMGYRVSINSQGDTVYDDRYELITIEDVLDIYYIFNRDFPNKQLPDYRFIRKYEPIYPPSRHISGNNQPVIGVDEEYYSICSLTSNPTFDPTSSPSPEPTTPKPTPNPPSPEPTTPKPTPNRVSITGNTMPSNSRPFKGKGKRKRKGTFRGKKRKGRIRENTIKTRVNPEVGVSDDTNIMNIKNRFNPSLDIDTSKSIVSEFDIQTDVSPYINIIGGPDQGFNIYTDVSPVIRLGTSSREVDKSPLEWNECFFGC